MPRTLRTIGQGLTHHVYSRCHGERDLLRGKCGRKFVNEAVNQCRLKYEFELVEAEIFSNGIHLVIKTNRGKESISRIMQYIKARIAQNYNRATGGTGAFWNERFASSVIE
ncbi:MAG: transposase [Spirochaetes bacterium]|nr:transposase [Spirochaetota bacterium]